MKFLKHKFVLLLILLINIPFAASAQCAMCRAALRTAEGSNMAEGINHGITYLMVFPYFIVAILGYVIYRIFKKESTAG